MPFISFYPIASDLQPLYLLPIIFLFFFDKEMQIFTKFEFFFLFLALFSIVYVDASNPSFSFRKSGTLLFALLTFHFTRVYFKFFNQKHLLIIVCINFFAVLFHLINPPLFIETFGLLVRDIKITTTDNLRGMSGFASEPGFMGALGVFYIAIALYLKDLKNQTRFFITNVFLSLNILLITQSGTGFMFIILFLIVYYLKFNLKKILLGLAFVFIILFITYNFDLGRGSNIIRGFINDPLNLLTSDMSMSMRTSNILLGIFSVYENIFGYGYGAWRQISYYLSSKYSIFQNFQTLGLGNLSAFAEYSVRIGIIFWVFLCYFIFKAYSNNKLSYMVLGMLYLNSGFSIAFPPIWILFAIVVYSEQFVMVNNNKQ